MRVQVRSWHKAEAEIGLEPAGLAIAAAALRAQPRGAVDGGYLTPHYHQSVHPRYLARDAKFHFQLLISFVFPISQQVFLAV